MRARPAPSRRRLAAAALAALVVAAAACSGDDGGGAPPDTTGSDSGCPLDAAVVAEALGTEVRVEEASASPSSCRYDLVADGHEGGQVAVRLRRLGTGGLAEARDEVEAEVGPVNGLPGGLVDGAEGGWTYAAGRAVQVAAARDRRLVVVAVLDPALDVDAAQAAAGDLASRALA